MWLFALILILLSLPLFIMQYLKGGEPNRLQIRLGYLMLGVGVAILLLNWIGVFPTD